MKRECAKRKSQLQSYQRIVDAKADAAFQCRFCNKRFINAGYLHAHLERRHTEHGPFHIDDVQPAPKPAEVRCMRYNGR